MDDDGVVGVVGSFVDDGVVCGVIFVVVAAGVVFIRVGVVNDSFFVGGGVLVGFEIMLFFCFSK